MRSDSNALAAALLGGAALLIWAPRPAPAQTPLEPVQYVYPDSTYEEIQQAIDEGGTVYFDRLTRIARQPADYDQVARTNPDVPPSPDDPALGFNIGADGRDVHIIGLLGPRGERPRINGGTAVFRAGTVFGLGAFNLPVSFRIQNLELRNPDLGPPQTAFSRIGIWVKTIGAQAVIDNCVITVVGKETDLGHAINHSVGIWIYLATDQPAPPPSGSMIDVTNNTVVGSGIHEAIHVSGHWSPAPGFVLPRPFVSHNVVEVTKLGGFPNGAGRDGATLASAIIVLGNLHDPVVMGNAISGDGRSPGVDSVAIGLGAANAEGDSLEGVSVVGNDSTSFTGEFQLWFDRAVGSSAVAWNAFGPATAAGVRGGGHGTRLVNNHFYGRYPGWQQPDGPGLFWFTAESDANWVSATKLNGPPHGFDVCGQVRDETGGANDIHGAERCAGR